jgi:hypothetical protein
MKHSDLAEARGIMQPPEPPAVASREHPTPRTGRLQLTRLDRQHQTLLIIDLNVEDMHVGNIEDCIGPDAPARTRTTHRVRHRRGFLSEAWSPLILKVPTPLPRDQHTPRRLTHPCSYPKSRFAGADRVEELLPYLDGQPLSPVFVLLFAATYFVMSGVSEGNFKSR